MQTIESSVLRVAVNEENARLINLVSQSDQVDYFKDGDVQKKLTVAFWGTDQNKNWADFLPWTVVDKGDTRVSLAMIDDGKSYQKFPYHFEVILSYILEGNHLDVKYYLKNNSHKEMPFSLALTIPILTGWSKAENVNEVKLTGKGAVLKVASSSLDLALENDRVTASVNNSVLKRDE
ncbi:aldose epimerase, partial [Lactobacillus sp. XV13L]|nr:aldose epimerase [Lactobacillus sp. XV13L]